MAKQAVTAELLYGGQWNDHTADAYTRDPIRISRGRGDEQSVSPPGTASLTFDNRDGTADPRNALSPLHGVAGRNTPLRIRLADPDQDVADAFGRTVVNGWGSADDGGPYTLTTAGGGSVNDFDVASGKGTMVVGTANGYRLAWLPGVSIADGEALVGPIDLPAIAAPTGGRLEPAAVAFRIRSAINYYLARIEWTTGNAIEVKVYSPAGAELAGATVFTSAQWTVAEDLMMRVRWEGATTRVRVWQSDQSEPSTWNVEVSDSTYLGPGGVGVRVGVAAGNTNVPVTVGFDAWAVTAWAVRHVGEVAARRPRRAIKGDAWIEAASSGILRRLRQDRAPLKSPVYRKATDPADLPDMVGYWPCEDGSTATQLASGLVGGTPMRIVGDLNLAASSAVFTGSQPLPELGATGIGPGHCADVPATGEIAFRGLFSFPAAGLADNTRLMYLFQNGNGVVSRWQLTYGTAAGGSIKLSPINAAGAEVESPTFVGYAVNGTRMMFGWQVSNVAGTAHWATFGRYIQDDGTVAEFGFDADFTTVVPADIGAPTDLYVFADRNGSGCVVGHFMVGTSATLAADLDDAIVGYAGERAGARFLRLCAEEGVRAALPTVDPATVTLDDSAPMGPQPVATLADLLAEIERTDGGMLYEARNERALIYRSRVTLYNQAPALELDFTAGQVAPPLEPDLDDQQTRNDVTVKRTGGSSARAVQETGPLNVTDPEDDPQGVGRYETETAVNTSSDDVLADHAHWRLHLGTVDATRYPQVTVDLDAAPSLASAAGLVEIGDLVTIDGLDADLVELIVLGYTETIGSHRRLITYNCAPAAGYRVAEADGEPRVDTDGTERQGTAITDSQTFINFTTTNGEFWVTGDTTSNPTDFPIPCIMGGEQVSVTAIAAPVGNTQVFTVVRSVNGVVKAHPVGTKIHVLNPAYAAL